MDSILFQKFEIHFKKFNPSILWGGGIPYEPVPSHKLKDIPVKEQEAHDITRKNPLSPGPYYIKEIVPGQQVVFEANPYYYKGQPKVKKVIWQCRFEVYSKNPLVIFDGAHNLAGVEELIKIVKQHFSKDEVTILVSILKDKDRVSMFRKLNEISSNIVLTSIPDNPRASTAKELYDYVENKKDFEYEEDPIKAYNLALSKKRKLTICCGSFYILIKLKEGLNG